jgi:hypothetical protein
MIPFDGRAKEITTIPGKPHPTGFKEWVIAQGGYKLQAVHHVLGASGGPLGVKTPVQLGGTKNGKGGNKTQAVVVHLMKRLPPPPHGHQYHVYLDNLFTSERLLELLRTEGIAATGTCRTNAGVLQTLVDTKKSDKRKDELPWGTLHHYPSPSCQVSQIGWKDQAYALLMSTVYDGTESIERPRKRPKTTSTSAKTSRVPFGDVPEKVLSIPKAFDQYNHHMGGVDLFDQYIFHDDGHRRIKRGAWQALERHLLLEVLTNTYLLSKWSGATIGRGNQESFRYEIIRSLKYLGQDGGVHRNRRFSGPKPTDLDVPVRGHELVRMPTRKDCRACGGGRHSDSPPKRVPLSVIAANHSRTSDRHSSSFGCKQCNVSLCKEGDCFKVWHRSG